MIIELTPEQKRFVEQQLASGKYADERALLQHALEVFRRREEDVAEVQEGYRRGLADLEAGRYTVIDTPKEAQAFGDELKRRGRELQAERKNAAR